MPRYTRRAFLRLTAAAGLQLVVVGGGGLAYVWRLEPGWLALERVEIPIPRLPPGLDGLRIAQLSDLHAGRDLPPERLDRAIEIVADLQPDLVVFTGDWVTYDAADARPAAASLASLRPPLGIYAILGNHDHWTQPEAVAQAVQTAGITLLRNNRVPLSAGDGTLWLAGLDDIWEQQHDLAATLDGIPTGEPVVLLAHEPDYADQAAADGRVALQLSGHSHGGQVNLPFLGPPVAPYLGRKYISGLYRVQDRLWLYTNRGIGTIQPAVRLNCRPEVTLITLRSA